MRTPKLIIVAIDGAQGPQEVEVSAQGLYGKYSARSEINKEVEVVWLSRAGAVRQGMVAEKKVNIEEGDVVGVYLVAHCGDMTTAVFDHNLADGIKAVLDARAGGCSFTLDKVCLVVCVGAKDPPELNHPMSEGAEAALIQRFAMQLTGAGLRPRLAGWTGYVTVDGSGRKKILSSFNFSEVFASSSNVSRGKQKMAYVYDDVVGYVRKDLTSWTDNT